MKSRTIIIILLIIAIPSVASSIYFYYSLNKSLSEEATKQATFSTQMLKSRISFFLSENMKTVKSMSGLKELPHALATPNDVNSLAEANRILDHFRSALDVEVCYLLDKDGKTIASSNRNDSDSFVGANYAIRPYFREAMQGKAAVYLALGLTSKKPGAYYSYPVYIKDRESPQGVAVIKSSVETIAEFFRQTPEDILLFTDPHGLVFMSSREMYRYRMLWKTSEEQVAQLAQTKQFGLGPFPWSGMELKENGLVMDGSGGKYLLYQTELENCPGWKVINLRAARNF